MFYAIFLTCAACSAEQNASPRAIASASPVVPKDTLRDGDGPWYGYPIGGIELRDSLFFAIPDQNERRIVVFDSSGNLVYAIGRQGQGPGEFLQLDGVFSFADDTLAAYDHLNGRVSTFRHGKLVGDNVRFDKWPMQGAESFELVGRFSDGRWVGLKTSPIKIPGEGLRIVVDTPALLAGKADEEPVLMMKLMPRRLVDVYDRPRISRVELEEVSAAIGAVCDEGVVVVDTTGVKYFDKMGRLTSSFSLAHLRQPMGKQQRAEIVSRAVNNALAVGGQQSLSRLLGEWIADVDSSFGVPLLDSRGRIWTSGLSDEKPVMRSFNTDGSSAGEFRIPYPAVIGAYGFVSALHDTLTDDFVIGVARIPRNAAGATATHSPMGWCSAAFRV